MLGRAEIRHTGAPQFSVDRSFLWTGPAAYKMVGGLTRPHSTSSPPPTYSVSPLTPFPPFAGVLLRHARIEVSFPPAFPFPQLCGLRRLISDSVALLLLCFSPRHAGSCLLGWWVSWLLLRCGFFSASLAFLSSSLVGALALFL